MDTEFFFALFNYCDAYDDDEKKNDVYVVVYCWIISPYNNNNSTIIQFSSRFVKFISRVENENILWWYGASQKQKKKKKYKTDCRFIKALTFIYQKKWTNQDAIRKTSTTTKIAKNKRFRVFSLWFVLYLFIWLYIFFWFQKQNQQQQDAIFGNTYTEYKFVVPMAGLFSYVLFLLFHKLIHSFTHSHFEQ